ncbi:MAG: hypothetical protein WAM82_02655 [Thermoanaerobaculia bacterium]
MHRSAVLALALTASLGGARLAVAWAGEAAPAGGLIPQEFQFSIDEISLESKGRVIVHDTFDRAGVFHPPLVDGKSAERAPYFVNMGLVDGSRVKGGSLVMDQVGMVNPFENFACDFSIPVDADGRLWFTGKELFGDFVLRAKVLSPQFKGAPKFKIGIVDMKTFFTVAAVSLGREEVSLQRQGKNPKFPDLPFIETLFGKNDVSQLKRIDEAELTLRIGARGELFGTVVVVDSGQSHRFEMEAAPEWSRVDPEGQYAAHLFWESFPKPKLFAVHPHYIKSDDLRDYGGAVDLRIFGLSLLDDSKVEILPSGGTGAPVVVSDLKVLGFNAGLLMRAVFPKTEPAEYDVRVTSGGEVAWRPHAIRVE